MSVLDTKSEEFLAWKAEYRKHLFELFYQTGPGPSHIHICGGHGADTIVQYKQWIHAAMHFTVDDMDEKPVELKIYFRGKTRCFIEIKSTHNKD